MDAQFGCNGSIDVELKFGGFLHRQLACFRSLQYFYNVSGGCLEYPGTISPVRHQTARLDELLEARDQRHLAREC